jgi:hypothetical protein
MDCGWIFTATGVANISPLFALLTLVLVLAVLVSLVLVKFKQSLLVNEGKATEKSRNTQ